MSHCFLLCEKLIHCCPDLPLRLRMVVKCKLQSKFAAEQLESDAPSLRLQQTVLRLAVCRKFGRLTACGLSVRRAKSADLIEAEPEKPDTHLPRPKLKLQAVHPSSLALYRKADLASFSALRLPSTDWRAASTSQMHSLPEDSLPQDSGFQERTLADSGLSKCRIQDETRICRMLVGIRLTPSLQ